MEIKLDMERAYDLMGWSFHEGVMAKFGFGANFVKLILACVRNPHFAVLINGSPTQWLKSTTSLRQGDPLSLYLFILGVEVFVWMIKLAQ